MIRDCLSRGSRDFPLPHFALFSHTKFTFPSSKLIGSKKAEGDVGGRPNQQASGEIEVTATRRLPVPTTVARAIATSSVGDFAPKDGERVLISPSEIHAGCQLVLPKLPRPDVRGVVMVDSGGLCIGQAGEFDYSGSLAMKLEGST